MTFVIAEPCIGTKDTSCVDVCPVDCIHPTKDEPEFEKEEILYIDPAECVGCQVCLKKCPAEAIEGGKKLIHVIDQDLCTHCGTCYYVFPPREMFSTDPGMPSQH